MKIVVEYSKEQNAFHRCPESESKESNGYVQIASFDSYEDADEFIKTNYENIKNGGYYEDGEGRIHAL